MNGRPSPELPNHEDLARLARDDPEAYESFRREMIQTFIDSAPARLKSRLTGIQFRVEGLRRLSPSGLGATVRIYELMWESFLTLNHDWQDFVRMKEEALAGQTSLEATRFRPSKNARVLEFRPRPPDDPS